MILQRTRPPLVLQAIVAEAEVEVEGVAVKERVTVVCLLLEASATLSVLYFVTGAGCLSNTFAEASRSTAVRVSAGSWNAIAFVAAEEATAPEIGSKTRRAAPETKNVVTATRRSAKVFLNMCHASAILQSSLSFAVVISLIRPGLGRAEGLERLGLATNRGRALRPGVIRCCPVVNS